LIKVVLNLSFIKFIGFVEILIAIKLLYQFFDILRRARNFPPTFYQAKKLKKVVGNSCKRISRFAGLLFFMPEVVQLAEEKEEKTQEGQAEET